MDLQVKTTFKFINVSEQDLIDLRAALETFLRWAEDKPAWIETSERVQEIHLEIEDVLTGL